jgi:hypothetical protein
MYMFGVEPGRFGRVMSVPGGGGVVTGIGGVGGGVQE